MTARAIKHFSHAIEPGGMAIFCEAGVFIIDDDSLIRALQKIIGQGIKFLPDDTLFFSEFFDVASDVEGAIEYLADEVGILQEIGTWCRWHFISPSKRLTWLAKGSFPIFEYASRLDDIETLDGSVVTVIEITKMARDEVERVRQMCPDGGFICVGFPTHDRFVISEFWCPGKGVPCPCCVYDYVTGNSYSSISDGTTTLSDIARQLEVSNFTSVPFFLPPVETILSGISVISTRLSLMNGLVPANRCRHNIADNVSFGLDPTTPVFFRVPLSPNCDCLSGQI